MFRSTNPTLREDMFAGERSYAGGEAMTIQGTVNKCFILLGLVMLSAFWVWGQVMPETPVAGYQLGQQTGNPAAMGIAMAGGIIGFIVAMVTIFKKDWAAVTVPIYALCEGAFLGGISAIFEMRYPGIVTQAVLLTFGVMFCMLAIYRSGFIQVDQKFIMGISSALGAIFLVYLVNIILGLFGRGIPLMYSSSPFGIGFSLIICGVASFSLLVDFHMIEQYSRMGLKKNMEWYGAFSLLVTLVWLYMEILRLLSKLSRR